jgi:hypothetical protein
MAADDIVQGLSRVLDTFDQLEGYEFVRSCEVLATEPSAVLVPSPLGTHGGLAMAAVCADGRQLALAKWALPTLHAAALAAFGAARAMPASQSTGPPRARTPDPHVARAPARALALATSSRCLVVLNGHCYSAWHARKRLLAGGALELAAELRLSALVLRRFPSAPDAWAHRRWLLARGAEAAAGSSAPEAAAGADAELERCSSAAAAKRANYYAGVQRQWLLHRLRAPPAASAPARAAMERELSRTTSLLAAHPTDSSAQYARQACVLAALAMGRDGSADSLAAARALASAELQLAQRLLATFAHEQQRAQSAGAARPHEVLVAHHRFARALCARLGDDVGVHGLAVDAGGWALDCEAARAAAFACAHGIDLDLEARVRRAAALIPLGGGSPGQPARLIGDGAL